MKRWSLCLLLVMTLAPAAPAQLPPDKALATLTVSDGLQIELFAAEPLFTNPTCIDIDHKGRVWVCESVNYRTRLRNRPPNRAEGDRIVILDDKDGDGKADGATTFYQAPDFLAPLGIAVAKEPTGPGYKVYVCHSPHLYLFEDRDGDGKADGPPKKLLTGFGGYDHDHGIHSVLIGPDGKLYFTVGDTGVKDLQAADGKGKKWTSNQTDCRAGTVWRCDQDGKNLELLAHNFRNNYEVCVDSFGTMFLSDNDDDGNQQTRICYVMPGGNYGYHPRGPGQTHWHEEQPGVVPKILRTYFGSPTGICMYEGTLLPKKYQGQILHTDAGPRHLRCYHLKPQGAGYDVEREDMVQSTDNWFRPSDVCVAPDGSVFISDWYDPGVGGHGMGDTTRGRIYRVTPKGHKGYQVPKVDVESKEGYLAALGSPNLAVRHLARAKLQSLRDNIPIPLLTSAIEQETNPWLKARAAWLSAWAVQNRFGEGPAPSPGAYKSHAARLLAVRLLKTIDPGAFANVPEQGKQAILDDPSAGYRRELLLMLRDVEPTKVKQLIIDLAKKYDGKDRFYLAALGIAVGHHDQARRDILLADFDKHFPEWNDKVANLVWELRPPSMLARLETQLTDAKIPVDQRSRIVDILATSDQANAGRSVLKVLQADVPPEIRARAVENLKLFLPGKWSELRRHPDLVAAVEKLLDKPETTATGLALVAAAQHTASVPRVTALAKDTQQAALASAAIKALGELPSAEAVNALIALSKEGGRALEAVEALGAHLPPRRGERADTRLALSRLQELVMEEKEGQLPLRQAALRGLSSSLTGTTWLIQQQEQKKLPAALVADAGRLLRNSPFQGLRNRALIAFPAPGKLDPNKIPSVASLLPRKGRADRGRQLVAASAKGDLQCLKCHTVRGVGGQIGPDLSMIGKKASRENLIESILQPSKAVADQYVVWVVETKQGLAVSGLLVEETPDHVTLRDANGKDTKIDKKEIETRAKSLTSIMPGDLLAFMTEDDLLDVVEYMAALQTPSLTLDYWHVAGPFANGPGDEGLDKAYPPEKGIDLKATSPGKSGPVAWRTVRPDAQGYVDLQALHGSNSPDSVSYLTRDVESPRDQEAVLLLGTDDGGKVWVNGALVFSTRAHRAAAPEQDTVKVRLKKGKNTLLLKIANGDGPHGLYLAIQSEEELKRLESK